MSPQDTQPPRFQTIRWIERINKIPIALRLISALSGFILLGTFLLLLPGIGTRPLTFIEALFTATSALTVTGLTVIIPAADLTFSGQVLLLILIQIGGIGMMTFTVLVFLLLGRSVSIVERLALRDFFGSLVPGAIIRLVIKVLVAVIILEGAGATILFFHWLPDMDWQRSLWFAIFHSVSALCNSGFDLFAGLPGYVTIPNDNLTIFVFGSLLFIGSMGVPVVSDLLAMRPGYRFTLHTRLTLIFIAILMALSTLVIFSAEAFNSGVLADEPIGRQLGLSLFQSISARTAGFVGVPSFESLTPASQLIIILVMFIGAAPASMGGGITTGTAIALLLSLWSYSRNRPYPEVGGRSITTITIRRATAVLTIALMVVFVATLLLLVDDPTLSLDAAIFEVVSAFATCGLTLAYTPVLSTFGRFVIILVMIWGRLGALTIMIAINRPTQQPLYSFPEEQILIG